MRKRFLFLPPLVGIFVFGSLVPALAAKTDKIAAIVNSDIITEEELEIFLKLAAMDEEDFETANPGELRKLLLERMIEDRLILQEAKRLALKVDEKVIDDRVREIRERAGGDIPFQEALKSEGISLTELKEKLGNQFLIFLVVQREVKSKVQVSPKEVTDYFHEHAARFMTPETCVVDSVFVTDQADLERVQEGLGQGADFQELAKAYSKKSSLGRVSRGQLKKELEDFIFGLQVGQCSRPFPMEGGYYLFLVRDRIAASQKTVDEVKGKIAAQLEMQKTQLRLKEWIEGLKDSAYISIRE